MARHIRRALGELSADSRFARLTDDSWWDAVIKWPPDVFAVTSVLLGESGAYTRAVSPPAGQHWPPRPTWNQEVEQESQEWWQWISAGYEGPPPRFLTELGVSLRAASQVAVAEIVDRWEIACMLLELHAVADEASAGFGMPSDPDDQDGRGETWVLYRAEANDLLATTDSLSYFSREVVQVLPKMRTPQAGISLRSLSAHLAIARFAEVEVLWAHAPIFANNKSSFNLLLLPVPLVVSSEHFIPTEGPLDNMNPELFGFFRFEPPPLDVGYVEKMLRAAVRRPGGVDGVVLPELAISTSELDLLKSLLESIFNSLSLPVPFLLAGVRGTRENRAHFSVLLSPGRWRDLPQGKHHRWALDRGQILNYRLGNALHPSRRWWEDIDVCRRQLRFIVANSWLGICPLICEDLARQDPVAQIIRSLGPTLVIALLLDGPQLQKRWPGRYATVLAEDPGSSVLTFTPLGMSERSVPPGEQPKRVIGLWKDSKTGPAELALEPSASALILTLCSEWEEEWMADGRSDGRSSGQLYLGHVEQLGAT